MAKSGNRLVDAHGETVPTAPYAYGGVHVNASQNRMAAFLESPAFTDKEKMVATWYLMRSPGQGEPIRNTISDIADTLKITRQGLTRIIKKLCAHGIVKERDRVGRTPFYALSPYLGGQGSGLDQRNAIREWNPPNIPGVAIKAADVAPVVPTVWGRKTA